MSEGSGVAVVDIDATSVGVIASKGDVNGVIRFVADRDFFVDGSGTRGGRGVGDLSAVYTASFNGHPPRIADGRVALGLREKTSTFDPWRWVLYALIGLAVSGFAIWQTGSARLGLGFAGALFVGFSILAVLAKVVAWAARRFAPRSLPYAARQGIANLHRPNNRTVTLLLALGLGTFLLLTPFLTRVTLLTQIEGTVEEGRPNLMFFDIQA